jgi:glycogen(starch) synthase
MPRDLEAAASRGPMRGATPELPISVVVCTDGRPTSLARTLQGLRHLDYPVFEICVVFGPTTDASKGMLPEWRDLIKTASCTERNLSQSRNVGINLAAGEVVAFIDDDAFPEPEWLDDLAAAYAEPSVGAAGGFVYDHTGIDFQARYVTTDRLGGANFDWERPSAEFNFPLSANFPHLLGTNCSFRRSALIEVGGFDEEYEYYLDETDLCCRLIDGGWSIAQIAGAFVHHKFLPSPIRRDTGSQASWYPIVKNKIYYGLVNRHGHHSVVDVMRETNNLVEGLRVNLEHAISGGQLQQTDRGRFWQEVNRAWEAGLARGFEGRRRLMPQAVRATTPPAFRNAAMTEPAGGRRTFCFLSREYPPQKVGGVGRYIRQLAASVAALGHNAHVITPGDGHDRVDFEDLVWVHRVAVRDHPPAAVRDQSSIVPKQIWSHSATMLNEIRRVAQRRPISGVYAPIWDCEGAAILRDGSFPLMVGMQTTLRFWMQSNPSRVADPQFAADFIAPMLALESELLTDASSLHAISTAIVGGIEAVYGISLASRAFVAPLGLADYRLLPAIPAPNARPGITVRVLFVGRLESRKGIDILLESALEVLSRFADVQFDIVGNDRLPGASGQTPRAIFEADTRAEAIRDRVVFHGEVNDDALRGFYAACDIFVAPSRFESFGLIFVEAMMYAKPVIGCRCGGMPEIIVEGETGLLAEPGDQRSLVTCITRLLEDVGLRQRLGEAGRQRYEHLYTPERMARDVVAAFNKIASLHKRRFLGAA